jgi:beta-glucosidase-like glycosyl hydrolase
MPRGPLSLPLLVPAIRLDQDAAAETKRALERARAPWLAGFLLFGGEASAVARLTADLRHAAGRPIFVASDMERGPGQQVEGLSHLPDLGIYGLAATPAEVEDLGERTAREARSVGVDVLFAPVLDVRSEPDNPIVGNRSFGWDPVRVARLGAAYCRGALRGGAAPVAKHYPGHGATVEDSHDALPVVRERASRLLARDLAPFVTALVEGGCPAVMTAHVAYPALDASGAIASYSVPLIDRLRAAAPDPDQVCVFTDALLTEAANVLLQVPEPAAVPAGAGGRAETAPSTPLGGETGGAFAALQAGCDALLYPAEPERVAAELGPLLDRGPMRAAAERAAVRVRALLGRLLLAAGEADASAAPVSSDGAREVARRAVRLACQGDVRPERSWVLVLDDDGVPQRGRALAERGRRAGVPVTIVSRPTAGLPPEATLPAAGATLVVMASVRAWKGASGVSPELSAQLALLDQGALARSGRLQHVWLAPRPGPRGAHVPGTGPDVEEALADVLFPSAT